MTTDNFTDAARAEATSRARRVTPGDTAADWSERMLMMEQFRQGAEWALTHPAAQKPTDYQIDVAMDAYAEASGQPVSRPWMEAAIDAYEATARRGEENR